MRLRFNDSDVSPTAAQLCLSRLTIKSVFLCLTVYCDGHEREAEWTALNDMCTDAEGTGIPSLSITSNYTAGDIERLRHIQLHEKFPPEQVFDDVAIPSAELHRAWTDTLVSVHMSAKQPSVLVLMLMLL